MNLLVLLIVFSQSNRLRIIVGCPSVFEAETKRGLRVLLWEDGLLFYSGRLVLPMEPAELRTELIKRSRHDQISSAHPGREKDI